MVSGARRMPRSRKRAVCSQTAQQSAAHRTSQGRSKTPARSDRRSLKCVRPASRLRRVDGSMMSAASRSSVVIDSSAVSDDFLSVVSRERMTARRRRAMAKGLSARQSRPGTRVRNCSVEGNELKSRLSKCQGARSARGGSSARRGSATQAVRPSGAQISAGRRRFDSAESARFAELHTMKAGPPRGRARRVRTRALPWPQTLATIVQPLLSSASSVTVTGACDGGRPASIGPLVFPGSPRLRMVGRIDPAHNLPG